MKGMILAAGLGTRLKPLTDKMPKPLLPLAGRRLIEYPILHLKKFGITEIVINLHYLGEQIEQALGDGSRFGVCIRYSWEKTILGTGGGIRQAAPLLGNEDFVVFNSDVIVDADLNALIHTHREEKTAATLLVRPFPKNEKYSLIRCDETSHILSIKPDDANPAHPGPQDVMYTGVQVISPELVALLPEKKTSCLVQDGYQQALARRMRLNGFRYSGYWNDLGTPERFAAAEQDFQKGLKLSYL